jgi:hypothetical protein
LNCRCGIEEVVAVHNIKLTERALCNETPEAVDTSEMNENSAPVPNIKEFTLVILGGSL